MSFPTLSVGQSATVLIDHTRHVVTIDENLTDDVYAVKFEDGSIGWAAPGEDWFDLQPEGVEDFSI